MAETEQESPEDYGTASYWLDCLSEAEKAFARYHEVCDNAEKLYASLEKKSESADRQFQIFWANLEVLKPSIYSRPPVPVVTPRFQSRKPLPTKAAEILERSLVSSFEFDDIDATMLLARDDLAVNSRGVIWLRYETDTEEVDTGEVDPETSEPITETRKTGERVPKEHLDRRDFLHEWPARKWSEVGWVARRSWLSRKAGLKRFGKIFIKAEMKAREGDPEGTKAKKVPVWEIWSKTHNRVIWVSPGMEELLDDAAPFLRLDGFFPCPRPAYGTVKPRTLMPVPDLVQYSDQLDEINELTARISSLSEALRLKGFYPGGASDIGDTIEAVLKDQSNSATLVPIANLAAFDGKSLKDTIVWLPVDMVAAVIKELIGLRRQLIDDVYQITGISDIMRGTTAASETATAQQLKSQYGSIRIQDRQNELIRLARDVTRIEAEIMAENFAPETLVSMSQVDDLPTDADIAEQIAQVTQQVQQVQQAAATPQAQAMAQENPEQAQQMLQQAQAYVGQLEHQITVEKVMALLREERTRPFVLDIETDSTIQPDENAAKQRANEFITAVGGFMGQALPLAQQMPQAGPMLAETLKFAAGQYRAGRPLFGVIDEFAEQIKQGAGQPQGPDPAQAKAEADAQAKQLETERKAAEDQRKAEHDERMAQMTAEHETRMAAMDERMKSIDVTLAEIKLQTARATAVAAAASAVQPQGI